jgi:hypothetical protein
MCWIYIKGMEKDLDYILLRLCFKVKYILESFFFFFFFFFVFDMIKKCGQKENILS